MYMIWLSSLYVSMFHYRGLLEFCMDLWLFEDNGHGLSGDTGPVY